MRSYIVSVTKVRKPPPKGFRETITIGKTSIVGMYDNQTYVHLVATFVDEAWVEIDNICDRLELPDWIRVGWKESATGKIGKQRYTARILVAVYDKRGEIKIVRDAMSKSIPEAEFFGAETAKAVRACRHVQDTGEWPKHEDWVRIETPPADPA